MQDQVMIHSTQLGKQFFIFRVENRRTSSLVIAYVTTPIFLLHLTCVKLYHIA